MFRQFLMYSKMIQLYIYIRSFSHIIFFFGGGLFRATTAACGDSQAKGRIRAAAAGLHHSSQQRQILNPLSETRDQTCVLMDVRFISTEPRQELPFSHIILHHVLSHGYSLLCALVAYPF